MDESKPIFPSWPLRGSPISSTSSSCSSSTSTAQPPLPTEQTKLPVKQRVVFPSDRTNSSFATYSDNINNNKVSKIFPNNRCKNKSNDIKVEQHDYDQKTFDFNDKNELRDGWEFNSQSYRNPSPPIAERIGKNDNFQKRRQDFSNRCNDRRNNYHYNHRGDGFNKFSKPNFKSNGDYMQNKRRRNGSVETDSTPFIDWSDCNTKATNRTSNMTTTATQTSPNVQHQATQSSQEFDIPNPGPNKSIKDAILIDSWVRSLLNNNISYKQENDQSNKKNFDVDTGGEGGSHFKNDNQSRIDSETEDYWATELKDKAQISSPKMDKPSVFSRLGKPVTCDSNNFALAKSNCQPVKQLYTEKNQPAAVNTLFNDVRVNPTPQKTQLSQEIQPIHQLKQPQKPQQSSVTSPHSQSPIEFNIRDPRIRKRLILETTTPESSQPKRQNNETPLDSIPIIPLIPLELVEEVHSSCQKSHEKKPLVIDLS